MNFWNIRTKLTGAIFLMTAVVLALGLWFGMGLLEVQVENAAIDERVEQFEFGAFDEVFLDSALATELFEDAVGATLVDVEPIDTGFETFVLEALIAEDDLFDRLVDEFGTPDDALLLWFNTDQVVSLTDEGVVAVVTEIPGDSAAIPIDDIVNLESFLFGQFDRDTDVEPIELAFGERLLGSTRIGFVADVTDGLDALAQVRNTMTIAVVMLTVLAAVATWFIAGRALRPVGAITDQVRAITSGTLSERVPEPPSSDEIGVLARTMNTMLGRLETSDLKRRQFVSDASHELRTPVAVLRSEAEVARRAPDTTTIDEFAHVVLNESGRLERLVEDLLALARGDESRRVAGSSIVDVDEVVLAEAARTRSLPVDQREVSAGRVVGHNDVMTRVIAHLLDNAARHGRSQVAVGVQTDGELVRVWVDDDGPGVSEAERERIFERFIRLDDARSRDRGGAGLGLAVVHEAVEQMGGTIEVRDAALGGARFQIELPAA